MVKHWILYTVLFCIGFLNVPRSLVHDCDSHASHTESHLSFVDTHDHHDGVHAEQDDCHVCEFQLDFFEVPNFTFSKSAKAQYAIQVPGILGNAAVASFLAYDLRGPPSFDLMS